MSTGRPTIDRTHESEADFDAALARVARLATALVGVPYAIVSIVEPEGLVHRVAIGLPVPQKAPRQVFVAACLDTDGLVWREDVSKDPDFADHPLIVNPPHLKFWCGVAIRDRAGEPMAILAVFDSEPRPYDEATAAALSDLIAHFGSGLELRRVRAELKAALDDRAAAMAGMEAFVGQAPVGLAILDRDMRFISVSPTWRRDFNIADTELVGRSHYEVMPFAEQFTAVHRRALAGEVITGEQYISHAKSGRAARYGRWDITPWRMPDGEIGGIIIISHDVTQITLSRQEAEHSEQRLKLALEISDAVVWEMAFADRTALVSGAVQAIFGDADVAAILQDDMFGMVTHEDQPRVRGAWAAHKATGARFRCEYRVNRPDGSEIWVQAIADTLKDESGAPERVIGVLMNITDRKLGELLEAEARQAAEAASRAKDEFLANMSHEIRTPLNGVMGVAGALARTELAQEQRQMVALIETSAHTLERLLSDLLDLARIESGRAESHIETFNLGELLDSLSALFEPRAREKGVGFERAIAPATYASFEADITRLKQIISNLLSNAVKFTEEGAVRLVAEIVDGQTEDQAELHLQVQDSGIGFSPETKERLFQRFEQADGSITRRYGGSGLGLSISRALAEGMHGSLDAESEPGKGAVFTLVVRLHRLSEAEADAANEQAGADSADMIAQARPPRILLAEDHPVNRKVVELILASAGVELTSVENGADAVVQFDAQPFDLILMDMQMPVMDGLTAIRTIRERERTLGLRRTPIVALTANAMPEHQEASRQAGADEHVCKPVSAQVLLEVVARQAVGDEPEDMLIAS